MARDAAEPAADARRVPEGVQRADSGDEGVLGDVLGVIAAAEP